jgi:hypothetical protein
MSLPEYASHWPLGIAAELDGYLERVVSLLYGAQTGGWWAARQKVRIASDLFLDEIIEPSIPFRANLSDFFRGVRMKINHEVIAVSEAHEKIRVTTKSINGTDEYEFDLVVVAAGGFNSPLLIKKSKIGGEMVGLNITDHPMGFVAKIASGNSPNKFGDLLARSLDLHPYEPMLKVCDQKSGLWTAFYLRPTLDAIIRSDPMVGLHPVRLTPA